MTEDDAAEALYGAPLRQFVEERKRLAADLRAAGDRAAAAAVAKLARPSMSAWVVNQLWRQANEDMQALFAAGAKLRGGDFGAGAAQRVALAALRKRAAEVLRSDGHAASEGTLLRVQTTLQALSAIGGFAPDAPGRLTEDRDPPGFEVLGGVTEVMRAPEEEKRPGTGTGTGTGARDRAQRREEERERRKTQADLERARKVLERARHAVKVAEGEVAEQRERLGRAEREADKARADLAEVESLVESIEKKL
jgi:hypothetical protein